MRKPLTQAPACRNWARSSLRSWSATAAPDLIIIDPLANALGGDDADANLMGALNTCVAEIMRKQRCTVLRVHHSGHGNQDRARGHSSLPAGVDTEIRVDEQEIALTKQRDDVRGKVFFKLEIVKLGKDATATT
jgi:RecA-family ATPase